MKIWSWPDVLTWLRVEYRLDPKPDITYLGTRDQRALAIKLDRLTTKEAARLLGMPESSVKTRLSRAKIRLRAALVEGM